MQLDKIISGSSLLLTVLLSSLLADSLFSSSIALLSLEVYYYSSYY